MSTLYILIFTSLFLQMIIKISGNHILQLRQFSEAYQAKSTLNMSEYLLNEYVEINEEIPDKGKITTSLGQVTINRTEDNVFLLTVTLSNNMQYNQSFHIDTTIPDNALLEVLEEKNTDSHLKEETTEETIEFQPIEEY